jgi:hypothetical protein
MRGGILLVMGFRMRNLLYIVPRLLRNWMSYLLLGMEHWISEMRRLKVGKLHRELEMLVLKLRTWDLHRCMTQERGSNKLTRLQKVRPRVAFEMLVWKHHLAFTILFHFF